MKYLSLTVPGPSGPIDVLAPPGVPTTASDRLVNFPQFAISILIVAAIVLAVLFIIYSGIQWIMSQGDPKAIEGARRRLTFSLVGLIIALGAFTIINIFVTLLGGQNLFELSCTFWRDCVR